MSLQNVQGRRWTQSLRLTFSYQPSGIDLIARRSVATVPLPSDDLQTGGSRSGFWVLLEDGDGEPLYRRVMINPLSRYREVFARGPATIVRQPRPDPSGSFILLVPDIATAKAVVFFGSPLQASESFAPAVELARFPLP